MSGQRAFRINSPAVVAETIDGEAMVINLKTGTYYSLRDSGADAWESLAPGGTLEDATDAVSARYAGDRGEIAAALSELVDALVAADLLVPADAGNGNGNGAAPAPVDGERPSFVAPKLEPYIDLQQLIQLDPIHETDDRGWPNPAQP